MWGDHARLCTRTCSQAGGWQACCGACCLKQEDVLADRQQGAADPPCFKALDFGLSLHLGIATSFSTNRVIYAACLPASGMILAQLSCSRLLLFANAPAACPYLQAREAGASSAASAPRYSICQGCGVIQQYYSSLHAAAVGQVTGICLPSGIRSYAWQCPSGHVGSSHGSVAACERAQASPAQVSILQYAVLLQQKGPGH